MTRPRTWGHELEAAERRLRRQEAARLVLLAVGLILGAAAVLVIGWLMVVGFLVTFG